MRFGKYTGILQSPSCNIENKWRAQRFKGPVSTAVVQWFCKKPHYPELAAKNELLYTDLVDRLKAKKVNKNAGLAQW